MLSLAQALASTLLQEIRNRRFLRDSSCAGIVEERDDTESNQGVIMTSPTSAVLWLCLLATSCKRVDTKIVTALTEAMSESLSVETKVMGSIWFPTQLWESVHTTTCVHIHNAINDVLLGPLMTEVSAEPLLQLAFHLLSSAPSDRMAERVKSSWTMLSAPQLPSVIRPPGVRYRPCDEGLWLIGCLFRQCPYARRDILR